jgi:hypothetical protein
MKARIATLLVLTLLLGVTAITPVRAEENPQGWSGELVWPREYSNEAGAKLVMYQPQVTEWEKTKRLEARVAIAGTPPGAERPELGTFEIEAATEVDLDTRLVRITGVKIIKHRFPTLDEAQSQKLLAKLDELLPKEELIVALDRVLASLERAETQLQAVETKTTPPTIFVSQKKAVLLMLDGKPIWAPIQDSDLEFAVNTNWDLFKLESAFYLRNGDAWLKASKPEGPWMPAGKLPKAFKKLPKDDENWKEVRESLPGKKITGGDVPKVYYSEKPAELIVTSGKPSLEEVEGTELLWVTNTESSLFLHGKESRFYYLVSGRWFRADDLEGPWQFTSHNLPEDFAKIPEDHPLAEVRASIPGTAEAQEAVLLAQIPQTAEVNREEATAEVTYIGDEPEFKEIEGTSMSYAANTSSDVIKVGDMYYLCVNGVWFESSSPEGTWKVTHEVPSEIYTIPSNSPVYHTTYVQVYDYNPYHVTFGYTSGYMGVYFSYGCMVFGTGFYYDPWNYYGPGYYGYPGYYPYYYGYPYSYGVGAYYNPYTGTYGRGASVYGPYGGMGRAAAFNPRTGTYARGGFAYGPYQAGGWASAYNPRTGSFAATRQGANTYSSWGSSVVKRGNDWARTARYSDSRGSVAGLRTSEGGAAAGFRGDRGRTTVGRTGSGDLYAGRDGNVYRRNEGGGWEKHGKDGWSPAERSGSGQRPEVSPATRDRARQAASGVDRSTLDQLSRDYGGRSRGSRNASGYGSWRSSGGSSRPSFGGGGRMGGRGGGIRRR